MLGWKHRMIFLALVWDFSLTTLILQQPLLFYFMPHTVLLLFLRQTFGHTPYIDGIVGFLVRHFVLDIGIAVGHPYIVCHLQASTGRSTKQALTILNYGAY